MNFNYVYTKKLWNFASMVAVRLVLPPIIDVDTQQRPSLSTSTIHFETICLKITGKANVSKRGKLQMLARRDHSHSFGWFDLIVLSIQLNLQITRRLLFGFSDTSSSCSRAVALPHLSLHSTLSDCNLDPKEKLMSWICIKKNPIVSNWSQIMPWHYSTLIFNL